MRLYLCFAIESLSWLSNLPKVILVSWDSSLGFQIIYYFFPMYDSALKSCLVINPNHFSESLF